MSGLNGSIPVDEKIALISFGFSAKAGSCKQDQQHGVFPIPVVIQKINKEISLNNGNKPDKLPYWPCFFAMPSITTYNRILSDQTLIHPVAASDDYNAEEMICG